MFTRSARPHLDRPPGRLSNRLRTGVGLALVATCVLSGPSLVEARRPTPTPAPATVTGMRILVTNDDGVQPGADSVGLYELRAALCAAGADVVVVGPWQNMSGASASITYGSAETRFTLTRPSIDPTYENDCSASPSAGATWGACITVAVATAECGADSPTLTPADAATLGATAVVQQLNGWESGPELVISGTNRGGNDGLNVNVSGTLGAATIASSLGYPSIALSASSSGDATANARATAAWAVGFVATLRRATLLPTGYVLSVNYPRVDRAPVSTAEWTTVAQTSSFSTVFIRDGESSFQSTFAACVPGPSCGTPAAGTDSAAYSSGRIAITPIGVDRTLGFSTRIRTIIDSFLVKTLVRRGAFDAG